MKDDKPWLSEPDREEFDAYGLLCVVKRQPVLKILLGYVGIPRTHPLYGVAQDALIPYPETWKDQALFIEEVGVMNMLCTDLDAMPVGHAPVHFVMTVHGGLSFSDPMDEHPDLWFFGFDCGHGNDFLPGMFETLDGWNVDRLRDTIGGTYRSFEYVKNECVHLAEQLAAYPELMSRTLTSSARVRTR